MQELKAKVAVITGAAEGIGKAIAVAAAAEGMRLVLADIHQELLDKTVTELRQNGAEVIGVVTDVSKENEIQNLADQAYAQFGKCIYSSTMQVSLLLNRLGKRLPKIGSGSWELTSTASPMQFVFLYRVC